MPVSLDVKLGNYQSERDFSLGLVAASVGAMIIFTGILAAASEGFQPCPGFYEIMYPIIYGVPGTLFLGSLMAAAIYSCKMHELQKKMEQGDDLVIHPPPSDRSPQDPNCADDL